MTIRFTAIGAGVALALGGLATSAHATNGYFSHGYGIKAKGMGGAGVALHQDAFAGANNPAQAAFAPEGYEVGVDVFSPKRSMSRTGSITNPPGSLDASVSSGRNVFLIPEVGFNKQLSNGLGFNLSVYGNGGMNTSYPAGPNGMNVMMGQGTLGVDLTQMIVAPTLAMKINSQHSVGASLLLVHQQFRAYGLQAFDNAPGFPPMTGAPGSVTNNGMDNSSGVGVRLGYLGKLSDTLSVGASYAPKVGMSRFKSYQGLFAENGDFDIPASWTVGMAWQASPSVQLAVDYQKINYSGVRSIANSSANQAPLGSAGGPGFGWKDIGVVKLGVQWQASPTWMLRAGYNKGQNPVSSNDVSFNVLAPGVVTDHLTLGATMVLDKQSDISFSYAWVKENSVSGMSMFNSPAFNGVTGGVTAPIQETVRMKQQSIGVQYSRRF